jgi:predicted molibdopterin-dependent oxidoreductase YjgC
VNGQWIRISWKTAIDEIGDTLLTIREKAGPDSVYWLGSAKFTNEAAYRATKAVMISFRSEQSIRRTRQLSGPISERRRSPPWLL